MTNVSDILSLLKKNSLFYLASSIVTTLTVVGSVVISKQLLPANFFVQLNLQLGAVVLLNSVALGWFNQSLSRFLHQVSSNISLALIGKVSFFCSVFVSIPIFLLWRYFLHIDQDVAFPLIYLIINAAYSILLIYNQASLQVQQSMLAELIRNLFIIGGFAILLLEWFSASIQYFWWLNILANLLALGFLILRWKKTTVASPVSITNLLLPLLKFGAPVSVWLFLAFLLTNIDKWYISAWQHDAMLVAGYVAITDLVQRAVGFAFSPVVSASYPLVARLFDSNNPKGAIQVINRVLLFEIVLSIIGVVVFILAADLLFNMMHIENYNATFVQTGCTLIVGNALWQISGMLQKASELQLKTINMLGALAVSTLLVYALFYWLVKPATVQACSLMFLSGIGIYALYSVLQYIKFTRKYSI